MNYLLEALAWIADPAHQWGRSGIWARLGEHLLYTVGVLALSSLIAIPLGYLVGHTGRGRTLVVFTTGAARALPTLGVVTLAALILGIGLEAPVITLVVLAIPSILAGAYAGVESADPVAVEGARALGFTEMQVLMRVEAPLGFPLLVGGLRSAALQVVSTATLAAYVGAGGLGRFLFLGLKTQDYPQMLAASILVVALAVALEIFFEAAQFLLRTFRGKIKENTT